MKSDSLQASPVRRAAFGRPGFSLIEMLIVIVVMGVVLSFTAPRLKGATTSVNVRGAASELTNRIATARQTAIRRGSDAILHVSDNKAWLMVDTKGVQSVVGDTLFFVMKYGSYVTASVDTIRYNSRGLTNLGTGETYSITRNGVTQTVCVTGAGLVLRQGCSL